MSVKRIKVLLDVLESGRGGSLSVNSRRFAYFIWVEKRQERVLDIGGCEFEDVEVFSDIANIDNLELLRDVVAFGVTL